MVVIIPSSGNVTVPRSIIVCVPMVVVARRVLVAGLVTFAVGIRHMCVTFKSGVVVVMP